jgi:peptidoglycan/LPS O-acetylase OafA/YrhL
VCVRKKKNNKRDDVREEEIEREKSCFLGYLFASFASFPLSCLSLYFFESHTTRKKRTPLSVSVLFRFLRDDDPHSFGAAAATFTRAHETTKQRKQSL